MKLQAFHKVSYGLYLVASAYEGEKTGYIANTVFQVTSKPPMLAISCHKDNYSTNIIINSGIFSVSVLRKELELKLINNFGFSSGNENNKFDNVKDTTAKTGAPVILDDVIAWFDCEVREKVDLGSHWLIIGEVVDNELISDDDPLTYAYYREHFKMFSPEHSPTYVDAEELAKEKKESAGKQEEEVEEEKSEGGTRTCVICGYTYDPEKGEPSLGIEPGTPFEDLPEDFRCPVCNAAREYFKEF